MSELSPEAEKFGAEYRKFFMPHLERMQNDHAYIHTVRELRKTCEKCDMDIAKKLSVGLSVGGKRRSKKRSKKHSKKSRRRRTTSRRRSRVAR
jgi:hypothetical protein